MTSDRRRTVEERRRCDRVPAVFAVKKAVAVTDEPSAGLAGRKNRHVQLCQAEDIAPAGMTIKRPRGSAVQPRTELALSFLAARLARGDLGARAGRHRRQRRFVSADRGPVHRASSRARAADRRLLPPPALGGRCREGNGSEANRARRRVARRDFSCRRGASGGRANRRTGASPSRRAAPQAETSSPSIPSPGRFSRPTSSRFLMAVACGRPATSNGPSAARP